MEEVSVANSETVSLDLPGVRAVFRSESMKRLLQMVERVARHNAAVLIIGETGTGKELIARAVHFHSLRSQQSWVDVNCGALPEHLVESELFGFEKGAFSGADASKPGFFELANKGTLFLDEVGELESKLQVKLLRVLDGAPYYRLGGTKKVAVDVRLVAATNQDLEQSVRMGKFREDLYHRLSQFQLRVPPLRERKEDILLLAEHFLKMNPVEAQLSSEAAQMLEAYRWPGNVRELRNVILRAVALSSDGLIRAEDLPAEIASYQEPRSTAAASAVPRAQALFSVPAPVPGAALRDIKRQRILEALARHNGHQGMAADELGISRRTLSRQLKTMREQGTEPTNENLGQLSQRQQNYFRSTLEVPVRMKIADGREFPASSTNLSAGGIALNDVPIEVQEAGAFQLTFKLPSTNAEVHAQCDIAWCSRDGQAGIRFRHMDRNSETELKRWMLQRQIEEGWTALQ